MIKIIIGFLCITFGLQSRVIPYPDFTESLFFHRLPQFEDDYERICSSFDARCTSLFESIYRTQIEQAHAHPLAEKPRIPQIIHQIWLGGSVPPLYCKWMESWASLAGWEYRLWTDEEVKSLYLYNRDLFDATENLGERSDILRLELLYQYGGLYVDTDMECVHPEYFEELHRDFDFYIGVEPLGHGSIYKYRMFKFCNAVIGSTPHHALLNALIKNLKANALAYHHAGVVERTGPSYITRIIVEYELRHAHQQRNIYLPTTFFYPITIYQRNQLLADPSYPMPIFDETAAIHYWIGSWRPNDQAYCEDFSP